MNQAHPLLFSSFLFLWPLPLSLLVFVVVVEETVEVVEEEGGGGVASSRMNPLLKR